MANVLTWNEKTWEDLDGISERDQNVGNFFFCQALSAVNVGGESRLVHAAMV